MLSISTSSSSSDDGGSGGNRTRAARVLAVLANHYPTTAHVNQSFRLRSSYIEFRMVFVVSFFVLDLSGGSRLHCRLGRFMVTLQ